MSDLVKRVQKKPRINLCEWLRTEDSYTGIKDSLDKVKESLDKRERQENGLRDQIAELKKQLEERTADDRVRELEKQIDRLLAYSAAGTFTETEFELISKTRKSHYESGCKCNPHMEVHWTGVGTAYVLKCRKCGLEVNITDYGQW